MPLFVGDTGGQGNSKGALRHTSVGGLNGIQEKRN